MHLLIVLSLILQLLNEASGHGRLMDPVARSSAWRLGYPTPRNYDDNALFCGGFARQQNNGGKCGVCGDPWTGEHENEAGGRYATGTIVKTYKMGETISAKTLITANHYGWMEFRICPNNDVTKAVTHDCLNKHVLELADGSGTRYTLPSKATGMYTVNLKLPSGMVCTQCVLQWKYHAANSWGVDRSNGRACIGCGPQEEFYGCSDVAIVAGDVPVQPVTQAPPRIATNPPVVATNPPVVATNPPVVATNPPIINTGTVCHAINLWAGNPELDQWCTTSCAKGNCPPLACDCSGSQAVTQKVVTKAPTTTTTTPTTTTTTPTTTTTTPTTTTTTPTTTTTTPTTTTTTPPPKTTGAPHVVSRVECKAINLWAGNDYLDRWCADACARGNCPADSCKCDKVQVVVTTATTTMLLPETKPAAVVMPTVKVCKALAVWAGIDVFDRWCTEECNKPAASCPSNTCSCVESLVAPFAVTNKPLPTTTAPAPTTQAAKTTIASGTCSSNGVVAGDYWNGWCQDNCGRGFCPVDYCNCNM